MSEKNFYFACNLPLQVYWDEDGKDARIVNYMPRKERICELKLSAVIADQSREEFFSEAASYFENLASLMRKAANGSNEVIYYHDQGM